MQVGDPFICHTAYCLHVLQGTRKDEFSDKGVWQSRSPAVVDEAAQQILVEDLQHWKELVKKYASVTKMLDPREMFILAMAVQHWSGPVLEIGTHRGITTCLLSEVMNLLKRRDHLYTIELFLEGYTGPGGEDEYPGEYFVKALKQFRSQRALHRVVPIVGDSHQLKNVFWGIRPSVVFLDGDHTEEGVLDDLQMLLLFNHPFICLVHDVNVEAVMRPVLKMRRDLKLHFVNFHTGEKNERGLAALSRP
ncbi:class I SAM-dependent methyltransferase [Candidatus Poribacteria bacterium]|nr:class I SAM-dependent methyltransferase [Candidatus Poribacteria bacterium]